MGSYKHAHTKTGPPSYLSKDGDDARVTSYTVPLGTPCKLPNKASGDCCMTKECEA